MSTCLTHLLNSCHVIGFLGPKRSLKDTILGWKTQQSTDALWGAPGNGGKKELPVNRKRPLVDSGTGRSRQLLQKQACCIRVCVYLVLFEHPIDQQWRLLLHPLNDSVGHAVVRLGAGLASRNTVLIIHILLGRPACVFDHLRHRERAFESILTQTEPAYKFNLMAPNWGLTPGAQTNNCLSSSGNPHSTQRQPEVCLFAHLWGSCRENQVSGC